MQDFRKLKVVDKAHRLVLDVYSVTKKFPRWELFGLTSQLRRACQSIPTNIAEGCGRWGPGEMARFLEIAMGSASEADYLLWLARDLDYLAAEEYRGLFPEIDEIKRMLCSLIIRVRDSRR